MSGSPQVGNHGLRKSVPPLLDVLLIAPMLPKTPWNSYDCR